MSVTTTKDETAEIFGLLEEQWITTPIAWPNAPYPPRDDYEANPDDYDGEPYVEPVINRDEAFNADIATSPRIRHPGMLTLNVRVPLNEGDGRALEYADDLAEIFRNETIVGTGIQFRAPTIRPVGREGTWYRVQVDCPYWRDSIH